MLLFLVKHLRPNIVKALQEPFKVMDGASKSVFLEMNSVILYILDTRNLGLKIEPIIDHKEQLDIVCFSDRIF